MNESKEITRETQMLSCCVNCEYFETDQCKHDSYDKDEYKDSCDQFVADFRFGFGKNLDEVDASCLFDVGSAKYNDYENIRYFNNMVQKHGLLETIKKLRGDSDKLAKLTSSEVSAR